MLDQDAIKRVLVVTAHPDDVDFGAGGTIATLTKAGVEVFYCICTNGDAGGFDRDTPRSEIAGIRQAEQRAAGEVLGVHDVTYLGYPDGKLEISQELRRDISRQIRRVKPDVVLTQSPERHWLRIGASHPDHMAAGEAALRAVYPDARNPFAHPELLQDEGLDAYSVPEVWVSGREHPNHWVDVTDTFELKQEALLCHVSQLTKPAELETMLRGWLEMQAEAGGLPKGRLAEAFYRMETA
ncbi:PIG-L family deacetylase [Acidothermaceae bacterium B102]|nr:PIG-L family deacetylase [Acidothermaceae bacterium B102]